MRRASGSSPFRSTSVQIVARGDLRLTEAGFGFSLFIYRGQTGRRVMPARVERDLEGLAAMDRSHS